MSNSITENLISLLNQNAELQCQKDALLINQKGYEKQLSDIYNAKSFKVWQLFNQVKKNPKLVTKGIIKFFKDGPKSLISKVSNDLNLTFTEPTNQPAPNDPNSLQSQLEAKKRIAARLDYDINKIINSKFYSYWQTFNHLLKKLHLKKND